MSLPADASFAPSNLPPQAAALAARHAELLRSLPPVLAASLLTQMRHYDWMFPTERRELEEQLLYLLEPPSVETQRIVTSFRELPESASVTNEAWTAPEAFLQSFTARLWQVHATEQFRQCGEAYGTILAIVREKAVLPTDRLAIVLVGKGARRSNAQLFAKLRQHGTYFTNVEHTQLIEDASAALRERAAAMREPYAHWLIDGGLTDEHTATLQTRISYAELQTVRQSLAERVRTAMAREGIGPEKVRSYMMALQPYDLPGFPEHHDAVMQHFAVRVLCDGSGTQSLSTSFVQWSAREALRRAQPATLVVRFAPRGRNVDFLDPSPQRGELDAEGALIDADMGAYYTWLNLQRLQSKGQTRFVAVAENGQGGVAIGPGMPAGTTAKNPATLSRIVAWMNS